MQEKLLFKKCLPCEVGSPTLTATELATFGTQVPKWEIISGHHLIRKFKFQNFAEALLFVNKVGTIAESEGHHPDISLGWGYVRITRTTHAVDGLSENDFILAAKIDIL